MVNHYQAKLIKKDFYPSSKMMILKFSLVKPEKIIFTAGQYLILRINNQNRLFSIFSSEQEQTTFDLMIKIIPGGLASNFFLNLNINDQAEFIGPAGVFSLKKTEKDKVFFATYSGLAPFWSMIKTFYYQNPKTKTLFNLFWGLRYFEEIIFLENFKELEKNNPGFHFYYCLSQEKQLNKIPNKEKKYYFLGRVNQVWEKLNQSPISELNQKEYYLCANRQIIDNLQEFLIKKGIDKKNIFFEKY